MPRHLTVLILLAVTQVIGWGVVGVLPVIAAPVAADLDASAASVFLGPSVMYVAMGLAAPWAGRAFRVHGTRPAMAAGAGLLQLCRMRDLPWPAHGVPACPIGHDAGRL